MNYKWIVLFLVHSSNEETYVHVKELFNILTDTGYNEEVKVLVLYGGLQYSITNGYKKQVTLKEIIKDTITGCLELKEVSPGFGAIDIGDDKKLNKIFSKIRVNFPAKRFLLFTWDHGSGFGIFKTDPRERGLDPRDIFLDFEMDQVKENISSRSVQVPKQMGQFEIITNYTGERNINSRDLGEIRGIEKKKITTSMLTNDELRNTIKYDNEARKVDLLIMMNCAMQMIETGYALHNAVDYLIAPETCIFWAGYDYKSIINKLCAHPEIETEDIGKYAINTIQSYYESTTSKDYFNDLVVSLVKPAKSREVKKIIDEIADQLNNKLPDSFSDIKNIRQSCDDLTRKYVQGVPYHYVDLLSCISALKQMLNERCAERATQAVQEYVIYMLKGNNYCEVNHQNNIGQVNGCTIYYPPTAKEADLDVYYEWFYKNGNQQTLFATDCSWKNFLINYLHYDRRIVREHKNS